MAGIGDNLLASVLVAWEYHRKAAIFCPACNVDMWNNLPTQRNVAYLKKLGVELLGPRIDRLTTGQVAIGCMESIVSIIERLKKEEEHLLSGSDWFFRLAKRAALENDDIQWELVLRAVKNGDVDINAQFTENGNTLLHLAAGGESYHDAGGGMFWGVPDLKPMASLISLGANVNAINSFNFSLV